MDMQIRRWRSLAVILLVGGALAVMVGCSSSKEESALSTEEGLLDGKPFGNLVWDNYQGAPVQRALDECVVLEQRQALLLHRLLARVLTENSASVAEIMALYGEAADDISDEHERRRREERAAALIGEEVDALLGRGICVEFDLLLDDYDFDSGTLQVAARGNWKLFRDTLGDRGYLHNRRSLPDGYAPPLVVALENLDRALTMPADRAEVYLGSLERIGPPAEVDSVEDDQSSYFTRPPSPVLWPEEASRALDFPELFGLMSFVSEGDEDRIEALEAYFRPAEGLRIAPAVAVVRVSESMNAAVQRVATSDGEVDFVPRFAVEVEQLVLLQNDGVSVEAIWPAFDDANRATDVTVSEPVWEQDRELVEVMCDGSAGELSRSYVVGEEIREEVYVGCSLCPRRLGGQTRELRVQNIARGSFSRAGVEEALIMVSGCGGVRHYHSGAIVLLRRGLSGQWQWVDSVRGQQMECEFHDTHMGTALPICNPVQVGEDIVGYEIQALNITSDGIAEFELPAAHNNFYGCGPTFQGVRWVSVSVVEEEEPPHRLQIELSVVTGASEDGESVCDPDAEVTSRSEDLTVSYLVQPSGVVDSEETGIALNRLREFLSGGGGR